jgi:protein ImuB
VVVGLRAAAPAPGMLFELTRNRLEQASIPKPVVAVRLLARELPPFVPASRDLFDSRPAQALPWPQLRERLRARLGDEAVWRAAPTGDPRPELAWRRASADDDAACAREAPLRPRRPAWLLQRPVPLRDPHVRIVSGPERLESGWWDGADARRDYYLIETSQGQRAWAFAPVGEQGRWMLHGWFA